MDQARYRQPRFRVLILGHGEMGHAFEHLLAGRHDVRIWQRRPSAGVAAIDLEAEARGSDFVLFCVPTSAHGDLAVRIAPELRAETVCLSIAKGLDDNGRTAVQVFTDVFGSGSPHGALYGPMISEEIRAGRPAFADCGCATTAVFVRVHTLLAGAPLALRHSTDLVGLSWSAVLKNVYAILLGVADELGLGDNVRGYLTSAALAELGQIVEALGGQRGTPYGLAGLADLVTTSTSAGSRHHELGRRLARGECEGLQGEGLHSLATIARCRPFDLDRHPLLALIGRIVDEPMKVRARVAQYLDALYKDTGAGQGPV